MKLSNVVEFTSHSRVSITVLCITNTTQYPALRRNSKSSKQNSPFAIIRHLEREIYPKLSKALSLIALFYHLSYLV